MTRLKIFVLIILAAFLGSVSAYAQTATNEQGSAAEDIQEPRASEASEELSSAKDGDEAKRAEPEAENEMHKEAQDEPRDIFDDIDEDVKSGEFDQSCSVPVV